VTEPTNALQEGPVTEPTAVAPTSMYDNNMLLDSSANHHISLNAAPSDPSLYNNHLTHLPDNIQD
jgi:hypothetical protein